MRQALTWSLLAGVAVLVWYSTHLAAMRIYQVDECQNVYMARILATHQQKTFFTDASGLTVPLSFLARNASRANDLFTSARFVMLEVFWLNIVLITIATGERVFSRRGLMALFGAASLAPLWDYGFEIRHDNLILTGLLVTWLAVRVRPCGFQSYVIVGMIAVGLQFVAFKSFAYTLPLSLAVLAFPPPGHEAPRWKLALAWVLGAVGTFAVGRLIYASLGLWDVYLTDLRGISAASTHAYRFAPWGTLSRLLNQTPLLLGVLAAALVTVLIDFRRRGRAALTWQGNLPEAVLLAGVSGVLLINPTPYPYNLLHWVPFAYLFAFRYAVGLAKESRDGPALLPVTVMVLVFAHLVPFGLATKRHADWTNDRQSRLTTFAENLTDPVRDGVYDGIGMIPTRPSICFRWFLHSLNIEEFVHGPGPSVRDLLATNAAAVFIPSYRTDWLPAADHDFVRDHYVACADDFWVLGKVLPAGGGSFQIIHCGRYRISSLQGSDLAGTYPAGLKGFYSPVIDGKMAGTLDGAPLPDHPIELTAGTHRIQTPTDALAAVVWVGPHLDRLHRLTPSDHRRLFVNWY